MKGNLFVITAPSGAGKTSLIEAVMKDDPSLKISISYTTRAPRKGEKEGVDYHFIDEPKFRKMKERGEFLESAEVHGNHYGTGKQVILDAVKRSYNVDENHVVLSGISDGATGLYYMAMRDTTPYASFLSLNGFLMVLANDQLAVDTELFPTNLLNKPFFIVNGGQDPLYPIRTVQPFVDHLRDSGVVVDYHPRPEAAHNTAWWPEMKEPFEAFVRAHPRDPLPATLTWEAADRDVPSRAHWLIIDRVRPAIAGDTMMKPDLNEFSGAGPNRGKELFPRGRTSGRVDLNRRGNHVEMRTRGVSELTLLLSPDAFDFSQPIVVSANGRVVSEGRVEPSVATLAKWAARDNDRTMLFGAELHIVLK